MFKKLDDENQGEGFQRPPMIQGDWTCSECGGKIAELPFEPAPDRPIYCRNCWAEKRKSFKHAA